MKKNLLIFDLNKVLFYANKKKLKVDPDVKISPFNIYHRGD